MNQLALIRVAQKFSKDCFPRDVMPPFFLMQVGDLVKNRYKISSILIDQRIKNFTHVDIVQKIILSKSPIVVLSADSSHISECLHLCRMLKEERGRIVCIVVGHAATYCSKQLCFEGSPVDYGIRGEYQFVLTEIVGKISKSPESIVDYIQNGAIYASSSTQLSSLHIIKDIEGLPLVPSSKQDLKRYHNIIPVPCFRPLIWGQIFTTYGCPNACTFCTQTIRLTYGKKFRTRDAACIIEDIIRLKKNGANIIEFVDDNLTTVRAHVTALCNEMIKSKINISWGAHVYIDDVDYEILSLMKRAGCIYVRSGIESGSTHVTQSIRKTNDVSSWNERVVQFYLWTKQLGIVTFGYIILGLPGETIEDAKKTADLVLAADPDIIKVHSFSPYPGTKIYDEMGLDFSSEALSELAHHGTYAYQKDAEIWRETENDIVKKFYFRAGYVIKHFSKFTGFYLLNFRCTFEIVKYAIRVVKMSIFPKKEDQTDPLGIKKTVMTEV